jgi:predicted metal-binding protein
MSLRPRVAYDIRVIHDCIVKDTDIYRTFNTQSKKRSLYRDKKKVLDNNPEIKKLIDISAVRSLDLKCGALMGKVGWLPTELVITDSRIQEMCHGMFSYPKMLSDKIGVNYGPCPSCGKGSACPPFSYTAQEARSKLDEGDIFIVLQSKNFIEFSDVTYPGFHEVLLRKLKKEIETLKGKDAVTCVLSAGACRLCHPKPCLGGGECRMPEHRFYALEAVGVPVAQLCDDMALLTGNNGWKMNFLKYFGTPRQTHKRWKLTCGIAVKLNE